MDTKLANPLLESELADTLNSSVELHQEEVEIWTTWRLIANTVAFAGIQFTWTVELAYGSPYLLSLGLPKAWMSLVWLAGPLSGLLVQPIIGVLSDRSTHSWGRRRPFIVSGTLLVVLSMLLIAFSPNIAHALFPLALARRATIALSVLAFYLLDFSINAVQACCRSLIMDIANRYDSRETKTTVTAQEAANTWAGRMIGVGNVLGYFMGYVDLTGHVWALEGGTQLQNLCLIAILTLLASVVVSCLTAREEQLEPLRLPPGTQPGASLCGSLVHIWRAVGSLPEDVQKLCNVQFFAWMGWFPFLFYSTSWVTELDIATRSYPDNKSEYCNDDKWRHGNLSTHGTQAGSFALLLYSIVSLVAGIVLPVLAEHIRKRRQRVDNYASLGEASSESVDNADATDVVDGLNAAEPQKDWLSLPSIFTCSLSFFALLNLVVAPLASTVSFATVVILLTGVCWAVSMWIPFSLIGIYMDLELQQTSGAVASNGTVLGIHNIYTVIPQLLVNFISSVIFSISNSAHTKRSSLDECLFPDPFVESASSEAKSFSRLFQLGGLMTLVGVYLSLKLKAPSSVTNSPTGISLRSH